MSIGNHINTNRMYAPRCRTDRQKKHHSYMQPRGSHLLPPPDQKTCPPLPNLATFSAVPTSGAGRSQRRAGGSGSTGSSKSPPYAGQVRIASEQGDEHRTPTSSHAGEPVFLHPPARIQLDFDFHRAGTNGHYLDQQPSLVAAEPSATSRYCHLSLPQGFANSTKRGMSRQETDQER